MSGILEDFNWELYESNYKGGNRLIPNTKIKGLDLKTRVFSHEPYAQEQFDLYNQSVTKSVRKDLTKGDCVSVVEISSIDKDRMVIELIGGLTVDIDLNRIQESLHNFLNRIDNFLLLNRSDNLFLHFTTFENH